MTPSQLIYEHIGSPDVDGLAPADGLCWVCGGSLTRGMHWSDWSGSSFVGQNRVKCPSSEYVCAACVFVCSRISPVPGRPPKEGKTYGGNWRNYSHLYDAGAPPEKRYINASKGEKPIVLAWLRAAHAGPWFAAIADSGQKHVLPWTPINPPGTRRGVVLFDEQIIKLPVPGSGWDVVDRIAALLTAGVTKDEFETGEFTPRAWDLGGERLRTFEQHEGQRLRGGAWFTLALWLAQRDEERVAARMAAEKEAKGEARRTRKGKASNADGRGAADGARRIPGGGQQRPEALDANHGPDAGRVQNEREPGGVVLDHPAHAADPVRAEPGQLSLFA